MQYDANTAAEYLDLIEEDWRKEKLLTIRDYILSKAPEIKEGVEYQMLSYGDAEKNIFHLNAQKSYVSLYVGNIQKVDNSQELLKGLDCGKGCVRIKKNIDLAGTKLDQFIGETLKIFKNGGSTAC